MNKILVVDDNQENLYLLDLLLSGNGFEVERAENGAEALERARRAPPAMIISDILMPVMDGFALCRSWRSDEQLKAIPFIFYTATYTGEEDKRFALSLGADRFIVKPEEPEAFMALVKETINNCRAKLPAVPPLPVRETEYYQGYNAALVRKLEVKMLQLEASNRVLESEIVERKRAEEERSRLEEQIIQARKLESVGRLAEGIAHDFNNMLAVICGSAELALMRLAPSDPVYTPLKDIQTAAQHSTELVRRLLAFARRQPTNLKVLDLNDTISGMLGMLRRLIGEQIEIAWKPGKDLWRVKMDPSQVDQILANLCVNARDAISGAGQIVIETCNAVYENATLEPGEGLPRGEYVRLFLRDNGCGMDKDTLIHIFDPFFTTKEVGKGTGLGLSTVYGIVKQNEGHVKVSSEPGGGTAFEIHFPRHLPGLKQDSEQAATGEVVGGKETILVAEDEPQLVKLIQMMLESQGYHVLAAAGPKAAIHLAETYREPIHLLVTDLIMPGMNGKDMARKIRELHPESKLLFMSGHSMGLMADRGLPEDEACFIRKPYSLGGLAAKVKEALNRERDAG